jgi:Holliday junction DNA helicase RuvA
MIAWLRGRVLDKQPNRIVVDVNGVGYDVHVPLSTFYELGDVGAELTLRVHTHVRDDQIALFGFLTAFEQQIFERLIAVNGIGPKLALAVLSGIEPVDLVEAVQRSDLARLTSIPGVGRKTAERIALELRDRLPPPVGVVETAAAVNGDRPDLRGDLLSALTNLGYHRPIVEKAVGKVLKGAPPDLTFEQALRRALVEVGR